MSIYGIWHLYSYGESTCLVHSKARLSKKTVDTPWNKVRGAAARHFTILQFTLLLFYANIRNIFLFINSNRCCSIIWSFLLHLWFTFLIEKLKLNVSSRVMYMVSTYLPWFVFFNDPVKILIFKDRGPVKSTSLGKYDKLNFKYAIELLFVIFVPTTLHRGTALAIIPNFPVSMTTLFPYQIQKYVQTLNMYQK